eukprot:g5953.t1
MVLVPSSPSVTRVRHQSCRCIAAPSTHLKQFEQVPIVLQFNKYIRSGYRCGYTYHEALSSTLELHNETGNIWSHLLPAIVLLWTLFWPQWSAFPKDQHTIDVLSITTSFICFLASVGYHTFMACDHHYHRWIRVDVCGIYTLLLGSQVDVFRLGFPCKSTLISTLVGIYFVIGIAGVGFSLKAKTLMTRGLPLLGLMVIRVGVLVSRWFFGSKNIEAWRLYLCAEILSLIGGVINTLRFPECLIKPKIKKFNDGTTLEVGWFDYWLNSHQIMHVLVAAAIFCMRYGLASDCYYIAKHQQCEQ